VTGSPGSISVGFRYFYGQSANWKRLKDYATTTKLPSGKDYGPKQSEVHQLRVTRYKNRKRWHLTHCQSSEQVTISHSATETRCRDRAFIE